jgi:predicted metal-dependent HD superfamily phosphohydrolase
MLTLDDAFEICELREVVRLQLKKAYTEPHRKYHTLEHLSNMLRWVPSLEAKEGFVDYEKPILLNAILFHDLVYLPKPVPLGYNECLSGVEYTVQEYWLKTPFVEGQLYPRLGNTLFEAFVLEAINASAHHHVHQANLRPTTEWFLDLDLQSLAQDYDEFKADSDACLEEMAAIDPKTNNLDFVKRQSSFLEALLARPKVYYRMSEWEDKARANIAKRLSDLNSREIG